MTISYQVTTRKHVQKAQIPRQIASEQSFLTLPRTLSRKLQYFSLEDDTYLFFQSFIALHPY